MKRVLVVITILLVSCGPNMKYVNKYNGYHNKPKNIEEATYEVDVVNDTIREKYTGKTVLFFDSKGRKDRMMSFKADGLPSTKGTHYTYSKDGDEMRLVMYRIDSTIISDINYRYNKYGQLIEKVYSNGRKAVTKSSFDRKNKTEDIRGTNGDSSFKEHTIQKYNDKWQVIELTGYDSLGIQEIRIEQEYDINDNKVISKWYNSKDELYEYVKTTYDEHNNWNMELSYNIKDKDTVLNQTAKIDYKYDKYNNIIERKVFVNDKLTYIVRSKYEY